MIDASTEKYLPIQSLDIQADTKLSFNLYVNLPLNRKIVLFRRAGGHVESARIEQFTQSNMSNLFIEKKDYMEFVRYVALRMKALLGNKDSEENRKMMAAAARSMLVSTINQSDTAIARAMMDNLSDITGMIIEGVLESLGIGSRKMFHRLLALAEKGSDFQRHPVNVASLATLITFGIGYSNQQTLTDMAMAALLHDIGLSKLPTKIIALGHDLSDLSTEEQEGVHRHPEFSVQILEEKQVPVSDMAKLIIRQHHEEFGGKGYPLGLRGFNINELSQILRVADEVDVLFSQFYVTPGNLKVRVMELLARLNSDQIVETNLLARIRRILI